MKLIIKRDQKAHKGLFGGHKGMIFILEYYVKLSPEEEELVERYQAHDHPLTFKTNREGDKIVKDTVRTLMDGVTEELKDITVLLNNEQVVKEACQQFKALLTVMGTFGGKEVITF